MERFATEIAGQLECLLSTECIPWTLLISIRLTFRELHLNNYCDVVRGIVIVREKRRQRSI